MKQSVSMLVLSPWQELFSFKASSSLAWLHTVQRMHTEQPSQKRPSALKWSMVHASTEFIFCSTRVFSSEYKWPNSMINSSCVVRNVSHHATIVTYKSSCKIALGSTVHKALKALDVTLEGISGFIPVTLSWNSVKNASSNIVTHLVLQSPNKTQTGKCLCVCVFVMLTEAVRVNLHRKSKLTLVVVNKVLVLGWH